MGRIRKSGGYRQLAAFQTATIIYDGTVWFCEKFIDRFSRTGDQMVQAARSGRQNIAEGSRAGATSSQTELRLVNVARSSLEELLLDFEDYVRHRRLKLWDVNGAEAKAVRQVAWGRKTDPSDQSDRTDLTKLTDDQRWELYSPWLEHAEPTVRANALVCLIHQANYLLDQQLNALEEQFINEGGYSEQLATARLNKRAESRRVAGAPDHRNPTSQTEKSGGSPAEGNANIPKHKPREGATSGTASPTVRARGVGVASAIVINSDVNRPLPHPEEPPACPRCGGLMALRTAKTGRNAGSQFWGCGDYPNCLGTAEV